MEATKLTHIQNRNQQAESVRASVIELLQMTELEYGGMVYQKGMEYLQNWIPEMQVMGSPNSDPKEMQSFWISKLSRTQIFWRWWRNHWLNRDECFLDSMAPTNLDTKTMMRIYEELHNGKELANEIQPHGVILEQSYEEMIKEIIKEEKTAP
jgi:hypothetical protein